MATVFIPGRSFCGRVIEAGAESTKVRTGDIVWGLGDVGKSGGLAELMVVNKSAVTTAPSGQISIEQTAALPLAGVPAFTAMATLCADLPREARILILNAHVGSGFIAMQLARILRPANDFHITAHVSSDTLEAENFCLTHGASDVLREDAVIAIGRIHESSYDVVLDTIGGRRIYDASRRVLHSTAYFVSLVGDELGPPSVKSQWKASLRSLRRAFVKKDRKAINYWLPMLGAEDDQREALDSLRGYVEDRGLVPVVKKVLRFEHGGEAFDQPEGTMAGSVIRIHEV